MQGYSVNISNGWGWYIRGWKLFVSTIMVWVWLLAAAVGLVLLFGFVLSLVPIIARLAQLAVSVVAPVILGGVYYTLKKADDGDTTKPAMLLQGFHDKSKTVPLIIVGLMLMAAQILFLLLGGAMVGAPMMSSGQFDPTAHVSGFTFLGLAVSFLLGAAVTLAFIYAVPLVMLAGVQPVEAVKSSFVGSISNIVPLIIFGVIYSLLSVIATIPVFLGFLVLMPVTLCALYYSYKDIFGDELRA